MVINSTLAPSTSERKTRNMETQTDLIEEEESTKYNKYSEFWRNTISYGKSLQVQKEYYLDTFIFQAYKKILILLGFSY